MDKEIMNYINSVLRPMAKADGGDLLCTEINDNTLIINAYGDCATCNSCGEDIQWWLNKKIESKFHQHFSIKIIKNIPYFDQ
ncbi:NifU family protein [Vallitalea okinawensis]|uniref:NifU family protein n=1 Tax=Vallitalea okinawensis TaxID=2078660 RepID=UPI001300AD1A|nr:NifU family protein [Vallitalea okinawensis]